MYLTCIAYNGINNKVNFKRNYCLQCERTLTVVCIIGPHSYVSCTCFHKSGLVEVAPPLPLEVSVPTPPSPKWEILDLLPLCNTNSPKQNPTFPLPAYPVLHWQVKDPTVLTQVARVGSQSCVPFRHSFSSELNVTYWLPMSIYSVHIENKFRYVNINVAAVKG